MLPVQQEAVLICIKQMPVGTSIAFKSPSDRHRFQAAVVGAGDLIVVLAPVKCA